MSGETLFEIDIKELDNPFERQKLESLPKEWLVELLVRHLKKEIKAIEYIKEHNVLAVNKEYLPSGIERCCSVELLAILGDKEKDIEFDVLKALNTDLPDDIEMG